MKHLRYRLVLGIIVFMRNLKRHLMLPLALLAFNAAPVLAQSVEVCEARLQALLSAAAATDQQDLYPRTREAAMQLLEYERRFRPKPEYFVRQIQDIEKKLTEFEKRRTEAVAKSDQKKVAVADVILPRYRARLAKVAP